jgi:hypothetical protein
MNTRGEGMNLFRSIMSAWVGQKMVERSPLLQEIRSEINKLLLLVLLALFCAIGIPALICAIVPNYAKKVTATYFLILFGSGAFRAYREGDKSRAKILAVPFGIVLLSFFLD